MIQGVLLQALVTVRLKADFLAEKAASGLELSVAFPKEAARMTCEYERESKPAGSQSWDWQERLHRLTWKLKRVQGGSDHALKVRASLERANAQPTTAVLWIWSCCPLQPNGKK